MRVIEELEARRKEMGMSYEELGRRTGYTAAYVQRNITGGKTPSIGMMVELTNALGAKIGLVDLKPLDGQASL